MSVLLSYTSMGIPTLEYKIFPKKSPSFEDQQSSFIFWIH